MQNSKVVVVPIRRAYAETYDILAEPMNYPRWSPVVDARFEAVGDDGLSFRVDLPRGERILRFSPRNAFGVLDYSVLSIDGQLEYTAFLRVVPNGEGTELVAYFVQGEGVSDEKFASDIEWARNDFYAIATVVEGF